MDAVVELGTTAMAPNYGSRPGDAPHLAAGAEEEGDQEVPRHAPSQQCEGQKKNRHQILSPVVLVTAIDSVRD
jgi:hypothetical protein